MINHSTAEANAVWKDFYKVAGTAALLIVLAGIMDIIISASAGEVKASCMIIFFPLAAFVPEQFTVAVLISMFGGLALMAYNILLARKLFQTSRASA